MEAELVPILDLVKRGRYEASIISSYNVFLPFYEEVVLRHLISSGCRHNILMMDAGQLSESLASPVSRPKLAGRAYTIVPINAKGAFHPKVSLFVSKQKGLLLVGSHNMTLSGWGVNKELTNCITFSETDEEGVRIANHAWAFFKAWVNAASNKFPTILQNPFEALRQFAPWLSDAPRTAESDLMFFGSTPDGESLWSKVSKTINGGIDRVIVLGPFFDGRLDFLQTLKRDLSPREMVVGVDPDSVIMPEIDHRNTELKFVDASQLAKASGYLHAKALYIEGTSGESWLVTGSANPSRPAWDASEYRRNAEAVILRGGNAVSDIAGRLGIADLKSLPPLPDKTWEAIKERVGRKSDEGPNPDRQRCLIGIAKNGCVQVHKEELPQEQFLKAVDADDSQILIREFTRCESIDEHTAIPVAEGLSHLRFLEIHLQSGKSLLCLVHHEDEIRRRSVNSRQAQFRRNLSALHDGNPNLENLIVTIEKIIFDEPFETDPAARRKSVLREGAKEKEPEREKEITSFATNLSETKREKRRKRLVTSGDIGYLLDYMIRRLDEGIERESPEVVDGAGPSEEELVGTDDEEPESDPEIIDTARLIKICNGKVRRLVGRMIKTFEQAANYEEGCEKCLVKLLGVLSLLRELRVLDYKLDSVPIWESFVPIPEREKLLKNALAHLYGRDHSFLMKIDTDKDNGGWEELSKLHGLLLWLAHDCGADLTSEKGFNESPEEKKNRIANLSNMLLITPDAVSDEESLHEAVFSIERTTPKHKKSQSESWIDSHKALGEKLSQVRQRAHQIHKKIKWRPSPGHVAFIRGEESPTLHLILKAGSIVELTDVGNQNGKRSFPVNQVASFKFPKFEASR